MLTLKMKDGRCRHRHYYELVDNNIKGIGGVGIFSAPLNSYSDNKTFYLNRIMSDGWAAYVQTDQPGGDGIYIHDGNFVDAVDNNSNIYPQSFESPCKRVVEQFNSFTHHK